MSRWQKERVGVKKKKRKAGGMTTNPLWWKKAKIYSRKSQENVKQLDRHFHFIAFLLFVAFSVGIALPFFLRVLLLSPSLGSFLHGFFLFF